MKSALKRREVFKNLGKHLQTIRETALKLDPNAETYLFGSVAENKHTYSSDIDVLIVTNSEPARMHLELWKAGIKEPFQVHVQPPEKADLYRKRTKLVTHPLFYASRSTPRQQGTTKSVAQTCDESLQRLYKESEA